MRSKIEKISIKGFKTLKYIKDFELKPLTVLIGANGAGKSNFITFFRMLTHAMTRQMNRYVVELSGGANNLLLDGSATTPYCEAHIVVKTDDGENEYAFRLAYAAEDTFVFTEEKYRFSRIGSVVRAQWKMLPPGVKESALYDIADLYSPKNQTSATQKTAFVIKKLLTRIRILQFHNTSFTSGMRNRSSVDDGIFLRDEGVNLPAFLYSLKNNYAEHYARIIETTRQILPFFHDYVLELEGNYVLLRWREKNSDMLFGAHSAADGMLRAMALVALLLQPVDKLPDVLILDEPELGLHPYAISTVGGLINAVSKQIQVIVATQSPLLLDCFAPEDIVVVERKNRESIFKRLDSKELENWLNDYTISELWEKNVIGGKP